MRDGAGRPRKGRRTLDQVRDGSGDPSVGPGRVAGPSRRSEMGQGTLEEVQEGSWDPRRCPGRVRGPFHR